MAASIGQVKLLEKLWKWAKVLQLRPNELNYVLWLSKNHINETYCTWQQQMATLNYYRNCGIGAKNYS
jgi:hypothetical protein